MSPQGRKRRLLLGAALLSAPSILRSDRPPPSHVAVAVPSGATASAVRPTRVTSESDVGALQRPRASRVAVRTSPPLVSTSRTQIAVSNPRASTPICGRRAPPSPVEIVAPLRQPLAEEYTTTDERRSAS